MIGHQRISRLSSPQIVAAVQRLVGGPYLARRPENTVSHREAARCCHPEKRQSVEIRPTRGYCSRQPADTREIRKYAPAPEEWSYPNSRRLRTVCDDIAPSSNDRSSR